MTISHSITESYERNRKEGLDLQDMTRDARRVGAGTIPQQQNQLWNLSDDWRKWGAFLSHDEKDLERIAGGTFRFPDGPPVRFHEQVKEQARKLAQVVASFRRAAFDEAEQYDLKAKGLSDGESDSHGDLRDAG